MGRSHPANDATSVKIAPPLSAVGRGRAAVPNHTAAAAQELFLLEAGGALPRRSRRSVDPTRAARQELDLLDLGAHIDPPQRRRSPADHAAEEGEWRAGVTPEHEFG